MSKAEDYTYIRIPDGLLEEYTLEELKTLLRELYQMEKWHKGEQIRIMRLKYKALDDCLYYIIEALTKFRESVMSFEEMEERNT